MESMQGILHRTSIQQAQNKSSYVESNAAAGQKRSSSSIDSQQSLFSSASGDTVTFKRASSIPRTGQRLIASIISSSEGRSDLPSDYSQRVHIPATPSSSVDPELNLAHPVYNLPSQLVQNFSALGVKQIYPWQKNCLKGPGLLNGYKNLVYCAPTGGGKSLVADLLMFKRLWAEPGSKALLVLPYVALVQEKVRWLRNLVQGLSLPADPAKQEDADSIWQRRADKDCIRVVGFFGGGKVRATWDDFDIGVCTLEKANALINTAIDECSVTHLKSLVLDELHMIDDDHRGYLLELISTKILSLGQPIQVVGMSATLPNLDIVARWLDAHAYQTRYRPIPIEEHVVHDGKIYVVEEHADRVGETIKLHHQDLLNSRVCPSRIIQKSPHKELGDSVLNAVVSLAYETASAGYGALIFAGSRAICETDARIISRVMPGTDELSTALLNKRRDLLNDLRNLNTGLDPILEETVVSGVAFHHAGLTSEERDIIAAAYDAGTLLICVATCSLAAGINLPARRVILHNARMGRELIGPTMLRQMRGRAGRQGKTPVGETYLCCRDNDLEPVLDLIYADIPEVTSCLNTDNRRIQRALLEIISVRLATSAESIRDYFSKSFISYTCESLTDGASFVDDCVRESLEEIGNMGLVTCDRFANYAPTQLGKAITASSIDPDDGIFIHKELIKSLQAFVMDGDMHILYTFTPVQDFGVVVNWQIFWAEMESLDESGMRVLEYIGIKPATVIKLAQGAIMHEGTEAERQQARVYRRFYLALQLRDLCNEVPIHIVARKYDTPRGTVQTLSQTCQGFAAGVIKFCEQMGWGMMAAALNHFSDRLMAGARADLLSLAQITFIKSRTARVFWESGFRTVASIANADPKELIPVLMQAQPTKVRLKGVDADKMKDKFMAKAMAISASANKLWSTS